MNGRIDAERVLDAFLAPEADRVPDRVIEAALADIARTPQRRALSVPWRFPVMTNTMRAAAGIALVVIVGVGVLAFNFRSGDVGTMSPAPQTASPAPPSAVQTTAPTDRPGPTTYVPGALTQTFTSDLYGVSLNYPEGWAVTAATEPWTQGLPPVWTDPTGDDLHDAVRQDRLFLSVVSRPLDGASLDEWLTTYLDRCTLIAGATISGADRVVRATGCIDARGDELALASSEGRGYVFELRASNDLVELRTLDTAALLDAILATVQLHPEDAVDQ